MARRRKHRCSAHCHHARSRALARRYGHENPLSKGAMIGLGVGAAALVGGIAYMIYKSGQTSTAPGTVAFNPADFQPNLSTSPPQYNQGQVATLNRTTGTSIQGTIANGGSYNPSGAIIVTIQVTTGDGTAKYPAGTTITGVPNNYLF